MKFTVDFVSPRPRKIGFLLCTFLLITLTSANAQQSSNFKRAPLATEKKAFNHERQEHKLECSFCHARKSGDASTILRLPYHNACINCHSTDFVTKESVLCAVCHEMPFKNEVKAISFPTQLRQYGVGGFSHRDHMDPAKMKGETVPQCETCHQFDSAKLLANFPSHPQCYSCHVHQGGGKFGKCEVCHVTADRGLKYPKLLFESKTEKKFEHSKHVGKPSIGSNCLRCHEFKIPKEKVIASDIIRMSFARDRNIHNSACWQSGCHSQQRSPRDLQCRNCHQGNFTQIN